MRVRNFIVILAFYFVAEVSIIAQSANLAANTKDSIKKQDSSRYKQEDVMDVIAKVVKIREKEPVDSKKLKPGKVYASVFPGIGYGLSNGLTFVIGANFSFYTHDLSATNLSTITFNPIYSLKQQIILPFISSIWLKDNTINIVGDYRFYQYPSLTYGLGA